MGARDNSGLGVWKYQQISTATTTVVFSGPGLLLGVEVVTGGASSTVTVYDNTAASGTKMIDTAATATALTHLAPGPQGAAVQLINGLTIVTATGTPAVLNVLFWPTGPGVT